VFFYGTRKTFKKPKYPQEYGLTKTELIFQRRILSFLLFDPSLPAGRGRVRPVPEKPAYELSSFSVR
jgi:hypothetical protein